MNAATPTVYLDLCCFQRPYDDLSQDRVMAEAEAALDILALCRSGGAELAVSSALWFEAGLNPHLETRTAIRNLLAEAGRDLSFDRPAAERAAAFGLSGLRFADAMHLACAVQAEIELFCTVDDQLLRRARVLSTGGTTVLTPDQTLARILP